MKKETKYDRSFSAPLHDEAGSMKVSCRS